ncbi:MAG: alanine--tRNA ligase [Planctomycetes bacterium]|nr:alanine--tRNA ligase [Planctomycetota bacterium]
MKTDEIRQRYLDFFATRGHKLVSSDSLIPTNDPTLLFTGAGMNQFKEEFMGHVTDFTRATTCQKCVRTGDIDNVGVTPFHFTFFEMLGNFSFGDYFKREAITWAWEFITEEMKFDPSLLYVTIYEDDDEAFDVWTKEVGLAADRVYRCGEHDNFWPADAPSLGPNGVCGPCSEIYVDRKPGPPVPPEGPSSDNRRFVEIWNLVFTQFDRRDGGKLVPLPQKNIDTGMGLERMAAVMQDVPTGYDIDLMLPVVEAAAKLTGQTYTVGDPGKVGQRLRRIADHTRCVAMSIADGGLPDRYGRGYVIRRLIRRAALDGRHLGVSKPFLHKLVDTIVTQMGPTYPEIRERVKTITSILQGEEQRFVEALGNSKGIREFEDALAQAAAGDKRIDGQRIFYFVDTHGLPLEFIDDQLASDGVTYDRDVFEQAMEARRQESRAGSNISDETMVFKGVALTPSTLTALRQKSLASEFVGYETIDAAARVVALVGQDALVDRAEAGQTVTVMLDRTPFYAEGGGQTGDSGELVGAGDAGDVRVRIGNTFKDHEFHLHAAEVVSGTLSVGDAVTATVNARRRMDIARNHTATHMLHWALRKVLGEHVHQAGSEVTPEQLRFDFTHTAAMTPEELDRVERMVNERIFDDAPVSARVTTIDEARQGGAMALFGEKYGNEVRMVSVGDFSRELCGGTHLERTTQVCFFKIVSEGSVAAGVRRITALTGRGAADHVTQTEDLLDQLMSKLKANNPEVALQRVETIQNEVKTLKQDLQKARSVASRSGAADVFANVQDAGGVPLVAAEIPGGDAAALREAVDIGRKKLGTAVLVFGAREGDKVTLIVGVTKDLVDKGLKAGAIIKDLAPIVGGGGGGRPDMAQAGGKLPDKLPEAIAQAADVVARHAKG